MVRPAPARFRAAAVPGSATAGPCSRYALGLAVMASLATGRADRALASGAGAAEALTDGYRLAFGVGLAFLIAAIVVAVVILPPAGAA